MFTYPVGMDSLGQLLKHQEYEEQQEMFTHPGVGMDFLGQWPKQQEYEEPKKSFIYPKAMDSNQAT